jgi:DNA-binding NarL/FixJ family response regulator
MPNLSPHIRTEPIAAPDLSPVTPARTTRRLAMVEPPEATRHQAGHGEREPIKVIIADGHALMRAGLCALLDTEEDITVIAHAADAEQAVALSRRLRPDVLLVDTALPPNGAVEATQRIALDPNLARLNVVMVTASDSDESVFGALRAGVRGFLVRDSDAVDLGVAVRTVARGDGMLSPGVARRLIDEFASLPDADRARPEQLDELTPREVEVVALVAAGLSNREIAERLVVTPATAKTHVSRALRKLDARDRAQLVSLAYECGLVVPRPAGTSAHGARMLAAA